MWPASNTQNNFSVALELFYGDCGHNELVFTIQVSSVLRKRQRDELSTWVSPRWYNVSPLSDLQRTLPAVPKPYQGFTNNPLYRVFNKMKSAEFSWWLRTQVPTLWGGWWRDQLMSAKRSISLQNMSSMSSSLLRSVSSIFCITLSDTSATSGKPKSNTVVEANDQGHVSPFSSLWAATLKMTSSGLVFIRMKTSPDLSSSKWHAHSCKKGDTSLLTTSDVVTYRLLMQKMRRQRRLLLWFSRNCRGVSQSIQS